MTDDEKIVMAEQLRVWATELEDTYNGEPVVGIIAGMRQIAYDYDPAGEPADLDRDYDETLDPQVAELNDTGSRWFWTVEQMTHQPITLRDADGREWQVAGFLPMFDSPSTARDYASTRLDGVPRIGVGAFRVPQ